MKTDDAERILKWIADSLEQGKDFVLDQAPDVVQELIFWKRCEWVAVGVIAMLIAALLWYGSRRLAAIGRSASDPITSNSVEGGSWMMYCLSWFTALVGVVFLVSNLQVWLAPKLFVLEYAAGLLR